MLTRSTGGIMASPSGMWITTTEAAQRLGVKRATLYAYVSRGLLRSERRPGQQESLFDRAQIDAIASATRPPGGPQPVLRFRSIATAVSRQAEGELFYRGRALSDVVALRSLEEAAGVVLGTTVPQGFSGLPETAAIDLTSLPLERRMPVAVQLLAAAAPFSSDTDPERVRQAALPAVRAAVALAGASSPGPADRARSGDLTALTLTALGGDPTADGDVAVLRVLLVALLDHGLTASTVAGRLAGRRRARGPVASARHHPAAAARRRARGARRRAHGIAAQHRPRERRRAPRPRPASRVGRGGLPGREVGRRRRPRRRGVCRGALALARSRPAGLSYTRWSKTCRRTQACIAMAAAAPALIERVEPNCSMWSTAVHSARIGSDSPGPSWPKTRTHRRGRSNVSMGTEPGRLSTPTRASPSPRAHAASAAASGWWCSCW